MLQIRSHIRSILLMISLFMVSSFATNPVVAEAPVTEKSEAKKPGGDKETPPAKNSVEGTLVVKDDTYKLTHVAIYEVKYLDEYRTTVLASSKPIPLDELNESLKKDGTDDGMFFSEPNVRLTFDNEGKLSALSVWADSNSISRSGGDDLNGEIKNKDGRITGNASRKSEADAFIKCDFDLKFEGNLIKAPKIEEKPESKSSKSGGSSKKKNSSSILDLFGAGSNVKPKADDEEEEMKEEEDENDDDKPAKKSSAKSLNVYDLPLPKDAKEVEYKKLVEHIGYKSATSVEDLAEFLVKGLKKQGWKSEDDTDLITANSAILNREQGDASLTIFVNSDGDGSKVTIMTEGLSWDKKKAKSDKDAKKDSSAGKKSAPAESEDEESEKEE